MPLPLKIEARLEGQLQQLMGSFWNSVFKDQSQVRVLLDSVLRTQVIGNFFSAIYNFAGDARSASLVRHVEVSFKFNKIIETGTQIYGDPEREAVFGENTDAKTVYGLYQMRYWALPLKDIIPFSIQTKTRQWIIGSDFLIHRKRYIYFREDPRKAFPDSRYLVVRGRRTNYRSYVSFFTQVDVPENEDLIVKYFRTSQTPKYFKLAICVVAGMGIIRKGGMLRAKTVCASGDVIYAFDEEMVRVCYPHEHLIENQEYQPLTIIGDMIQVFQAETKPSFWWRQIDWRGGMALDPILSGFRNLFLPDAETVAYTAGQDDGSVAGNKVHARLRLTDDFQQEKPYWDYVQARETETGYYLNNVIGLSEEADSGLDDVNDTFEKLLRHTEEANLLNQFMGFDLEQPQFESMPHIKWVNALDVFFQALLGLTSFVIVIDQNKLKRQKETFSFIARELSAGGTPIIMGLVSGLVDDTDLLDRDLVVKETVVITILAPVDVHDSVNLDIVIRDRVFIRQETALI